MNIKLYTHLLKQFFFPVSPGCARLLNVEVEGGKTEQRNILRRDLAQNLPADSSKVEVRISRISSERRLLFYLWLFSTTVRMMSNPQLTETSKSLSAQWHRVWMRTTRDELHFCSFLMSTGSWWVKLKVAFHSWCYVVYRFTTLTTAELDFENRLVCCVFLPLLFVISPSKVTARWINKFPATAAESRVLHESDCSCCKISCCSLCPGALRGK